MPTGLRGSDFSRSLKARQKRDDDFIERRLQYYKDSIPTIRLPFALEDLNDDKAELEDICNHELGYWQSPQCFSAKFVDVNLKPVLFYFGFRRQDEGKTKVGIEFNFIF